MTEKQRAVYLFLINYLKKEQRSPSIREIMLGMKYKSPRSIFQFLDSLEELGYIKRKIGSRNIYVMGYKFTKIKEYGR